MPLYHGGYTWRRNPTRNGELWSTGRAFDKAAFDKII